MGRRNRSGRPRGASIQNSGFELQVDQERQAPFLSNLLGGRSGGDRREENDSDSPRGFNNPNITFSIKFKNIVKNNNYEFIVTIAPEDSDSPNLADLEMGNDLDSESQSSLAVKQTTEYLKQYKVKRNLYEFQELFNFLEGKNPNDPNLRQFDYNQMFQTFGNNEGQNIQLLGEFIDTLVKK